MGGIAEPFAERLTTIDFHHHQHRGSWLFLHSGKYKALPQQQKTADVQIPFREVIWLCNRNKSYQVNVLQMFLSYEL